MVLLLTLLTAAYTAVVVWVRREKRRRARPELAAVLSPLPADDQPPSTAVGWPPTGAAFEAYLADGFAALDAFLSEDHTS